MNQLRMISGYCERCINDQSAPFCLAGVLATELPKSSKSLAAAVRGHFVVSTEWLQNVLMLGVDLS
jgi:TetR/AcrR family transcriptional repressor of nem operon